MGIIILLILLYSNKSNFSQYFNETLLFLLALLFISNSNSNLTYYNSYKTIDNQQYSHFNKYHVNEKYSSGLNNIYRTRNEKSQYENLNNDNFQYSKNTKCDTQIESSNTSENNKIENINKDNLDNISLYEDECSIKKKEYYDLNDRQKILSPTCNIKGVSLKSENYYKNKIKNIDYKKIKYSLKDDYKGEKGNFNVNKDNVNKEAYVDDYIYTSDEFIQDKKNILKREYINSPISEHIKNENTKIISNSNFDLIDEMIDNKTQRYSINEVDTTLRKDNEYSEKYHVELSDVKDINDLKRLNNSKKDKLNEEEKLQYNLKDQNIAYDNEYNSKYISNDKKVVQDSNELIEKHSENISDNKKIQIIYPDNIDSSSCINSMELESNDKNNSKKDSKKTPVKPKGFQISKIIDNRYHGVTISVILKGIGMITGRVVFYSDNIIALQLENGIVVFINSNFVTSFY